MWRTERVPVKPPREALLDVSRQLVQSGLNTGTAGNVSVRDGEGFLITPSGLAAERMTAHDMVWMRFDGSVKGAREPSSEWRLHADILRTRPEAHAVVHTHATYASTLACLRREVPAFHYLYKALSPSGNPEFATILKVVAALGLRLHAAPFALKKAS